jgi:outer membrane protein assembly factor BamD (BamD/ComL family)/dienelactone hydrolase
VLQPRLFRICLAAAALLFTASTLRAADPAAGGVPPDQATFTPGKEVKILDPKTGGLGWYVVYVPKDYTPDRDWPTIFCYHGKNNDPKTWPFKEATDGQGYVIVGMDYINREGTNDAKEDIENLNRIRAFVSSKVRVNNKLIFMGGFSQGGWSTSKFSNLYMDQLAGLLIMGAGGSPAEKAIPLLKGKPVFVGIGELDDANKNAKLARDAYTAKGADVTFEEFKGLPHTADVKDPVLKDWLLKWGPHNQMMASLTLAKAAEKAGKMGEAYTLYTATAKMNGGQEAADLARQIEDAAQKKLDDAQAAIAAKKYPDAVKTLVPMEKLYAGSPFAQRATDLIQQVRTDPAIKAEIDQAKIDATADAVQAQAQAAEKSKEFARALALYETYVAQYPKATRFAEVKARYDQLKSNPAIQASAKTQAAERECKSWLSTADNYITNNMAEKAKPYLQKLIDKYPDTPWAPEARKRLSAIKN